MADSRGGSSHIGMDVKEGDPKTNVAKARRLTRHTEGGFIQIARQLSHPVWPKHPRPQGRVFAAFHQSSAAVMTLANGCDGEISDAVWQR